MKLLVLTGCVEGRCEGQLSLKVPLSLSTRPSSSHIHMPTHTLPPAPCSHTAAHQRHGRRLRFPDGQAAHGYLGRPVHAAVRALRVCGGCVQQVWDAPAHTARRGPYCDMVGVWQWIFIWLLNCNAACVMLMPRWGLLYLIELGWTTCCTGLTFSCFKHVVRHSLQQLHLSCLHLPFCFHSPIQLLLFHPW